MSSPNLAEQRQLLKDRMAQKREQDKQKKKTDAGARAAKKGDKKRAPKSVDQMEDDMVNKYFNHFDEQDLANEVGGMNIRQEIREMKESNCRMNQEKVEKLTEVQDPGFRNRRSLR
jgi:hypothetical protein